MSAPAMPSQQATRPLSVRRHVRRKMLWFSLCIGAIAAVLAAGVYVTAAYPSLQRAQKINLRTLSEINCRGDTCDASEFATDWQLGGSDYVIDVRTRYFVNIPTSSEENPAQFSPLDFSDTTFIMRFRQPTSYPTPDEEVWRMYSQPATWDGQNVEILIGYAEKAPWKMIETPRSLIPTVDERLREEAEQIAKAIASAGGRPLRGGRSLQKLSADGFVVVNAKTSQIVAWGPWLPLFLPKEVALPQSGRQPYVYDGEVYIVQTDTTDRLLATSLVPVGSLWWMVLVDAAAFIGTFITAWALSRRFLRNYFALTGVRVPDLGEACKCGEGQNVEFKRGLSEDESKTSSVEDELLKSIAAFANTNDGVIFIGVDDAGSIRGLRLDFSAKDRLERKVRQLTRTRIKPTPPIQVTFEEIKNSIVAKIVVARGEAFAYLMNGVIYVRDGSSDVQAQPEHLGRLVTEFGS